MIRDDFSKSRSKVAVGAEAWIFAFNFDCFIFFLPRLSRRNQLKICLAVLLDSDDIIARKSHHVNTCVRLFYIGKHVLL
jgi:hypothetical protein